VSENTRSAPLDEFRRRVDHVLLLAIAAAEDEGIHTSDFLDREFQDAIARLSKRGFIERDDDAEL
jgi:hypothetical protein